MVTLMLPIDKANHFIAGSGVYLVVQFIGLIFGSSLPFHLDYRIAGMVLVVLVGAGKELSDWILNQRATKAGKPPPHGVEFFDALATWCGGAVPFISALVAARVA